MKTGDLSCFTLQTTKDRRGHWHTSDGIFLPIPACISRGLTAPAADAPTDGGFCLHLGSHLMNMGLFLRSRCFPCPPLPLW